MNAPLSVSRPAPPGAAVATVATYPVSLTINGRQHDFQVEAWVTLLDLLRERAGLTGSKKGCDHGQCGACTVLVGGRRINACLTLAVMQNGREVTTVEGLAQGAQLHPLQQAFIDHDAFQCGYCTSGQLCSGVGLINETRARGDGGGGACSTAQVRELMSGNVCRCGAYPGIVAAITEVMGIAEPDDPARPYLPGTVPA
jgi:xanthine dehydrogenase YagT iron-sulfur-binding subunit